jgi:hypothetical protein
MLCSALVFTSQSMTVLLSDPDASHLPFGENATGEADYRPERMPLTRPDSNGPLEFAKRDSSFLQLLDNF